MFNRKSFGLLASLCLAGATSPYMPGMPTQIQDPCAPACGSAASSSNPYGDMNNLLKSGNNCPSPYNPLNSQMNQYGNGGSSDSCISPGYYPQQGPGYSYPGTNGMGTAPVTGMTSNDECEVITSIECKPKKGGSQNFSPAYSSYGQNSSVMPVNIVGGGASTGSCAVPGNSQVCDYSKFTSGMPNSGYQPSPPSLGSSSDVCNCSQLYNQSGISGQQLLGGNGSSISGQKPLYCGSNSGSGYKNQFDNSGFMGGRTPGSVFNTFDCYKPQAYPIKTAIIGTSELPISDNFRAMSSSCGPAQCF